MYNKLFTKILDSSIWLESSATRIVWLTIIAAMDEHGFVQFASVANVAHRARVTLEEAQEAIARLEGADPDSSDPDHDGRRLERVPGGWMVLNADKHRAMVTKAVIQEQTRERVRRHRSLKRTSNAVVTPSEAVSEAVSVSKAGTTTTPIGVEAAATAQEASEAAPRPPYALIPSVRPATLVTSPLAYERLQKTCAFVGSALQVPHVLHGEFLRKVGADGETRLQAWYLTLNEQLEASGEGYGDAFAYLRPRFAAWATPPAPDRRVQERRGLPVPSGMVAPPEAVAEALETRRRRAEMLAIGMTPEAIEEVFDQEYEARKAAKENR